MNSEVRARAALAARARKLGVPEWQLEMAEAEGGVMVDVVADSRRSDPIFGPRPLEMSPQERAKMEAENRKRDEREKAEEAIRAERQRTEDEWRRRGDAFAAGFGGPEDPNARWREERLRQLAIARLKAADPR